MPEPRHRRCGVVRGDREQTRAAAAALVCDLEDVLWVSRTESAALRPSQVRRVLGVSRDAVVLDLHDGPDADLIAQSHGFVRGGGLLLFRLPPAPPQDGRERLVTAPFTSADVGMRFWDRLERFLAPLPALVGPLPPPPPVVGGTTEQSAVAAALQADFSRVEPSRAVLIADRGRGKSSALGMALAPLVAAGRRIAITADSARSAAEVVRFSGGRYAHPLQLLEEDLDVLVIDEAARLPVPLLQALVRRHPSAHVAFASTVRGYEGTGRGFVLRFLSWLEAQPIPVRHHTLHRPIRWDPGDPVEDLIFSLLALDAAPAPRPASAGPVSARAVDRDDLAADEGLLRQVFGLLVHAHYRTTPGDLHRMLDAPNLGLHVLQRGADVVAVTLVAQEGGLPAAQCQQLAAGRGRLRGHALPDTLMTHAGQETAGMLRMIRSVRIATHPKLRRQGLARQLVEHVHDCYQPDLFGTMFGATAKLLRFRRAMGYELARVGVSRGARTGEPSAVMLRPCSPAAHALLRDLREALARDLPIQLEQGRAVPPAPDLRAGLAAGLGPPVPLSLTAARAAAERYAFGPCPSSAVVCALRQLVQVHAAQVAEIPGGDLLWARLMENRSWLALAAARGMTVPAVQRVMRRAAQALLRLPQGR